MSTSPSSRDRIAWMRLSSCYPPLATPSSDAKVPTGRQKPMTEIALQFAEVQTADGHAGLGLSCSKPAVGPGRFAHAKDIAPAAFATPKGLPADIRSKLHEPRVAGLNDAAFKPKLQELGFEIVGNTPEQSTAFQTSEFLRWKKVVETGKITAD